MALTKVTGHVIKSDTNIISHNINSSGIITAITFDGNVSGVAVTFTGDSTIGSLGITTNLNVGGISTFTGNIDVDGHTDLDNVSIVGVATVTGSNINIEGGSASLSQLKINSTGRYRGIQLDENGTRKAHFQHDATDNKTVVGTAEGTLQFNSGDTPRVVLNSSGHWVPYADSTYDLGITGTRWRNVYTDHIVKHHSTSATISRRKLNCIMFSCSIIMVMIYSSIS